MKVDLCSGMQMADITLDFQKGTIKQDLAVLPEKMKKSALEAVNEGADFMVNIAKIHCLVDTGSLQKSIRKERTQDIVRVRAGGYVTNPKTGRIVDYAVYVEQKNPFMRPAWEATRKFVLNLIRQKVVEAIKQ